MSNYAALATLGFRIVSILVLIYGVITSIIVAKVASAMGSTSMLFAAIPDSRQSG